MEEKLVYTLDAVKPSMKLMDVIKSEMHVSTRWIRQLKQKKLVLVNGYNISMNAKLRVGDTIELPIPKEENIFEPEDLKIQVLYEDDHFIVVNKPPGMVVHPTKGHPFHTLANGIAYHMQAQGDHYKIRFAHRLDRDTSGALIVCKHGHSQKWINDQMSENSMVKGYLALVKGRVEPQAATIDLPIAEPDEGQVHRYVSDHGARCISHYQVVDQFENHALVRVNLETGRTHQIRVHLSHLGYGILGDSLYGHEDGLTKRQCLHAKWLKFKNLKGDWVEIEAPLFEDMLKRIEEVKNNEVY